jgi:16S rRNA (cytosine967-C5)-methyltransferase
MAAAMAAATRLAARDLAALVERFDRSTSILVDEGESLERFAERHAFPAWIAAELEGSMTRPEMGALFDALNERPPFAVRVNTARATVEEVAEALRREGLTVEPGAVSPHALRLGRERDLFATEAFRTGLVEVQDEGSQLVSIVTDPRPGEHVLDLCAGSGGKTLHLGALMRGRGEVFAYDTDRRRLANADRRVRRSGLQNVRVIRDDERFAAFGERWRGKIDRVLVDAPCSGLGTVRRAPDIKLRATPDLVDAMVAKQRVVLATAARFVRPGGRLVYATCSILPRENEAAVEWLLDNDPTFSLVPDAAGARALVLAPHRNGTDGFFIAVFERDAARSQTIEDENLTA